MYPILWFPLIDRITNNGIFEPTYRIGNGGVMRDGIFQTNLRFEDPSHNITYSLGSSYNYLWGGFSISFFLHSNGEETSGILLYLYHDDDLAISVVTNGPGKISIIAPNDVTLECPIGDTEDSWGHIAITYNGTNLCVYSNGKFIASAELSMVIPETEDTCFSIGDGFGKNTSTQAMIFNMKLYDEEISKRRILYDYYCMCTYFTFDGSSAELAESYIAESDCSGFGFYGFAADSTNPLVLTSTPGPTKQYSVSIPTMNIFVTPITPMTFTINFLVYLVGGSTETQVILEDIDETGEVTDTALRILLENENTISINANGNSISTSVTKSEWHMITLIYPGNGILSSYIDGVLLGSLDVVTDPDVFGIKPFHYNGGIVLENFPGVISDYKEFLNPVPISELMRFLKPSVAIDDKGTVYANDLTIDNERTNFAFNNRGGILSPEIQETSDDTDESVMRYNFTDKILTIKDFEEF